MVIVNINDDNNDINLSSICDPTLYNIDPNVFNIMFNTFKNELKILAKESIMPQHNLYTNPDPIL